MLLSLLLAGTTMVASSQNAASDAVQRVIENPKVKAAEAALARGHDKLVADIVTLTEIPAPPFKEAARAAAYRALLVEAGLTDAEIDAEGNVTALRKGAGGGPLIVFAAHLDTVFPEGTPVRVRREGTRLFAPGVGDDTRALVVAAAIARAIGDAHIETTSDILFVGDVGEEGAGDLRGMKYLFTKSPYKDRIKLFVSMDGSGAGNTIVTGAVGSVRYRVSFKGPGGHSFGSFGLVNPAYALATAVQSLAHLNVPSSPRTTYNVGVIGGGTSVNAIPSDAWMDVDLRSESRVQLDALARQFTGLMQDAAAAENAARSTVQGPITVSVSPIGQRPAGQTGPDSPMVQTAAAAVHAMGMTPVFESASTDANIPISLGIPAITIDSGGRGGRAHSLDEWIDVEPTASLHGIDTALVMLLAMAGME